jgi:hypothetical protein
MCCVYVTVHARVNEMESGMNTVEGSSVGSYSKSVRRQGCEGMDTISLTYRFHII